MNKMTQVQCKTCSKVWMKYFYDIKKWHGECKSCAKVGNTIATGNKGKSKTLAHRQKISMAHKGKPKPYIQGSKHYDWKGGVTPLNQKIRQSLEYKLWREAVFKRDNYTCVSCGDSRGHNLNADHIRPFALFPELRFAIDNGRTLCVPCHKKTPTYGYGTRRMISDNSGDWDIT